MSDGNVGGRALIDSSLSIHRPAYPEALFWRASLASNAADAESDTAHSGRLSARTPAEDACCGWRSSSLHAGQRGRAHPPSEDPRDYPRSRSLARAATGPPEYFSRRTTSESLCANANALAQAERRNRAANRSVSGHVATTCRSCAAAPYWCQRSTRPFAMARQRPAPQLGSVKQRVRLHRSRFRFPPAPWRRARQRRRR